MQLVAAPQHNRSRPSYKGLLGQESCDLMPALSGSFFCLGITAAPGVDDLEQIFNTDLAIAGDISRGIV